MHTRLFSLHLEIKSVCIEIIWQKLGNQFFYVCLVNLFVYREKIPIRKKIIYFKKSYLSYNQFY